MTSSTGRTTLAAAPATGGEVQFKKRVSLTFTDEDEYSEFAAAAARAGLKDATFAHKAAMAAARGAPSSAPGGLIDDLRSALSELAQARSMAGRIGGLFNQAVRGLNATGEPPENLGAIAQSCQEKLLRLEEAVEDVRKRIKRLP